jgi:isopentenyl-diphosphate delta-isomerase
MPAPTSNSFLDQVDETDQPVGRVQRGDVFRLGAGFRVVHLFVQNEQGDLLLQQVGAFRERSPLRWGSSAAGYLHVGETYIDAGRRRLVEELGLTTSLTKLGGVRMPDEGATKFIELYGTVAGSASINEPGHIERIEYWPLDDIERALADEPGNFTETFPYVFGIFRVASGRRSAL